MVTHAIFEGVTGPKKQAFLSFGARKSDISENAEMRRSIDRCLSSHACGRLEYAQKPPIKTGWSNNILWKIQGSKGSKQGTI